MMWHFNICGQFNICTATLSISANKISIIYSLFFSVLLLLPFALSLCSMYLGSQFCLNQSMVEAHPCSNSMTGSYFRSLLAAEMSKYRLIINIFAANGFSFTLKLTTCFGVPEKKQQVMKIKLSNSYGRSHDTN